MIGAIAGDIIGSVYEFSPIKTKEFPLFRPACRFTDDTVLTVAVADALMTGGDFRSALIDWGRRYPKAGYGREFMKWLASPDPAPYGSGGNGSAMRVSPVGRLGGTEPEVLRLAAGSARPTHDHPDGIRGAEAVALAVFLARSGESRALIRSRLEERFGYDLGRTVDEVRSGYRFDPSCSGSVPEAIVAFLGSESWEDAVRNAVSLGGDSDTQACIAGAVAEAYYGGVPDGVRERVLEMLPREMRRIVTLFESLAPPSLGRGARNPQFRPDPDTLYEHALSCSYEYAVARMVARDRSPEQPGATGEADRKERSARQLVRLILPSSRIEKELDALPAFGRLIEAVRLELGDPLLGNSSRFGEESGRQGIAGYLYLGRMGELLLAEPANLGACHEVAAVDGRLVLHTFCSAIRREWGLRSREYGEAFGPMPEWTRALHPERRIGLAAFALDCGLALPERLPACLGAGEGAPSLPRPHSADLDAVEAVAEKLFSQ